MAWAQNHDLVADVIEGPGEKEKCYHLPVSFGMDRAAAGGRGGDHRAPQWVVDSPQWEDKVAG